MNNNGSYALVFGVSVFDICGFTDNDYRANDSNPGRVRTSFGGVCRNIAECMARVGVNTKFISVLGDDETGKSILQHSKVMNYNMEDSLIVKNGHTPTYMAVLDHFGEMVSAVVDMKIIDEFTTEFIDSKAEIMCGFKINNEEDLRKAGKYFTDLGVKNVFITLDEDGIYYNNGVEEGKLKANDVKVVNVTGAGDSFVSGITKGYMDGYNLIDTLKYAISMSSITISTEETIHPDMCHDLVSRYIQETNWTHTKFNN